MMLKQQQVDQALFQRFPEPVCLVVTKDKTGRIDLCPIGFFSLVAWEPKIYNWDDKRLGNIKLGDISSSISYSPEGLT